MHDFPIQALIGHDFICYFMVGHQSSKSTFWRVNLSAQISSWWFPSTLTDWSILYFYSFPLSGFCFKLPSYWSWRHARNDMPLMAFVIYAIECRKQRARMHVLLFSANNWRIWWKRCLLLYFIILNLLWRYPAGNYSRQ